MAPRFDELTIIHIQYDYNQPSIVGVAKWQVGAGADPVWAGTQLLLYINLTSHRGRTNKRGGHFFCYS